MWLLWFRRHQLLTRCVIVKVSRCFDPPDVSVYEHLVTTAARDQLLVPTTCSQDIFLNIAGNPTDFCLLTFFFFFNFVYTYFILKYCRKIHGLLFPRVFFKFYNTSRKTSGNSMTSRFLICIFYLIILLGNPDGSPRI